MTTYNPSPARSGKQKLGVWHNPTANFGYGLGPWGSIAALVCLLALLLSYIPADNKLRNVTITWSASMIIVAPFAIRDRWGRNLYAQASSEVRWRIHRATGRNLYEGAWFSTQPVTMSDLPGLLFQLSIGEHYDTETGDSYGILHHPTSNTASVVIECNPQGAALLEPLAVDTLKDRWNAWLEAMSDEPGLASIQVVTEAAPSLRQEAMNAVHAHRLGRNDAADVMLSEMVEACTGRTTTKTWISVSWTDDKNARRNLTADVLPARVERLCIELEETGAGVCRALTKNEIAHLWAGMYDPARRETLARFPEQELHIGDIPQVVQHEHRDRFAFGGYDSVSLTLGVAPTGEVTPAAMERLAKGIDGAVCVRWGQLFRPVTSVEARSWANSIARAIETRLALRGERTPKATDVVDDEDNTATSTALARGATLTRIGFAVTLTVNEGDDLTGPVERTRAAVAPLSPLLRLMDGVHQSTWTSTLPGALPIPEALTPSEGLNQ